MAREKEGVSQVPQTLWLSISISYATGDSRVRSTHLYFDLFICDMVVTISIKIINIMPLPISAIFNWKGGKRDSHTRVVARRLHAQRACNRYLNAALPGAIPITRSFASRVTHPSGQFNRYPRPPSSPTNHHYNLSTCL
jgi:hypothetical protein